MSHKFQNIIDSLTLEEKASLTSGKDFWSTVNYDDKGIPSIFLSDGPHGLRKQANESDHLGLNKSLPATCFPTAATMANSFNPQLGQELGKALGEEALAQKVNVVLGPGLNIKRSPLCGRNFEYFSEDPYLAGKMAGHYVKGIQNNGISACLKHFACNSQEENRMTLDSVVDERTLREIYLTGFEIAVKEAKPLCIMSSYNLINGTYANENKHTLVDILRKEWKYKGVVVTDWGGDNDRIEALKCYNELEMPSSAGITPKEIVDAINSGTLDESVLDDNVDSLLNLITHVSKPFKYKKDYTFDVEAHHDIARKCAEESIVLLKNNNVLPLNKKDKVCFIGDFIYSPRYQGAGSSIVNATKLEKTVDLIPEYFPNCVGTCRGYNRFKKTNKKLVLEAIDVANKSDIIVFYMGLDEYSEVEGLDRVHMGIPNNQLELLDELAKLNKKIVVVLSCGSAVELPFLDKIDGLVHGYLSGQAGSSAVLNILSGKVNPSGKLAESYPQKYSDVVTSLNFPSKKRTIEYREALGVGYRYLEKANIKVNYPFGFGLSYSSFKYSDLEVTPNGVSFNIENISDIDGKEVAQMYVGLKNSKIIRPVKELKGFKKVFIKASEKVKIEIPFDEYTFRYFSTVTNKYEIEEGTYDIYVGSSSLDTPLVGTIDKIDSVALYPYDLNDLPNYRDWNLFNVTDNEFSKLLGREIPDGEVKFIKKNRIIVDYNTTVIELKYARGWTGRAFSRVIRFAIWFLKRIGKTATANTLVMGVVHQPMRGLSRLSNGMISWNQLNALIEMFNGHFFKGIHHFLHSKKKAK